MWHTPPLSTRCVHRILPLKVDLLGLFLGQEENLVFREKPPVLLCVCALCAVRETLVDRVKTLTYDRV